MNCLIKKYKTELKEIAKKAKPKQLED